MAAKEEVRAWAVALHLSLFGGYIIPLAGFVAPILIWQLKRGDLPELEPHGRIVANWLLSSVIYAVACFILAFLMVGVPLAFILMALSIIFPIIGAVKAGSGEAWKYPLSIRFF